LGQQQQLALGVFASPVAEEGAAREASLTAVCGITKTGVAAITEYPSFQLSSTFINTRIFPPF
jgi:hypothetical protein